MKEKINKLKQELESDETIQLVNFNLFPGIEDKKLEELEKEIKIPDEVKAFYKFSNGWQVRWFATGNKKIDTNHQIEKDKPFDWMWSAEHYWQLDGVINILPLNVILEKDWKDFIWFDFEKQYDIEYAGKKINLLEFKKRVKPVDIFDKNFTTAFYVNEEGFPVFLGDDHNVDFLLYEPMDFEKYLNLIIESKGEVNARQSFFKKLT